MFSRVLPRGTEPAGFTLFFHEINGQDTENTKTPVNDTVMTPLLTTLSRKGSLFDSFDKSGRNHPRTEMRESHGSDPSTIEHAKSRKINEKS